MLCGEMDETATWDLIKSTEKCEETTGSQRRVLVFANEQDAVNAMNHRSHWVKADGGPNIANQSPGERTRKRPAAVGLGLYKGDRLFSNPSCTFVEP